MPFGSIPTKTVAWALSSALVLGCLPSGYGMPRRSDAARERTGAAARIPGGAAVETPLEAASDAELPRTLDPRAFEMAAADEPTSSRGGVLPQLRHLAFRETKFRDPNVSPQNITGVALGPDGSKLLAINQLGRIYIWDIFDGRTLKDVQSSQYTPSHFNKEVSAENPYSFELDGERVTIRGGISGWIHNGTHIHDRVFVQWGARTHVLDHQSKAARSADGRLFAFVPGLGAGPGSPEVIVRNLRYDEGLATAEAAGKLPSLGPVASSAETPATSRSQRGRFKISDAALRYAGAGALGVLTFAASFAGFGHEHAGYATAMLGVAVMSASRPGLQSRLDEIIDLSKEFVGTYRGWIGSEKRDWIYPMIFEINGHDGRYFDGKEFAKLGVIYRSAGMSQETLGAMMFERKLSFLDRWRRGKEMTAETVVRLLDRPGVISINVYPETLPYVLAHPEYQARKVRKEAKIRELSEDVLRQNRIEPSDPARPLSDGPDRTQRHRFKMTDAALMGPRAFAAATGRSFGGRLEELSRLARERLTSYRITPGFEEANLEGIAIFEIFANSVSDYYWHDDFQRMGLRSRYEGVKTADGLTPYAFERMAPWYGRLRIGALTADAVVRLLDRKGVVRIEVHPKLLPFIQRHPTYVKRQRELEAKLRAFGDDIAQQSSIAPSDLGQPPAEGAFRTQRRRFKVSDASFGVP